MSQKVIIVGAGLTGLLTAVELIKLGFDVTVTEQADKLRSEGGGLGIWPPGVAILQSLGLSKPLQMLSGQLDEIKVGLSHEEPVTHIPLNIFDSINGLRNIFVVRAELQQLLATLVPKECIQFNKKYTGLTQDQHGVYAHFADDTRLQADFLIGADGIFSKVRQSIGINVQLKYTGIIALGGIIQCPNWQPKHEFITDVNRLSMLMPVSQNRYYSFMVRPLLEQQLKTIYRNPIQQLNLFENFSEPVDTIIQHLKNALTDENLREHFFCQEIYDADVIPNWSHGKVVLLGEAAHPIAPILGLGTSLCFQGVASLINSLNQYPHNLNAAFHHYQKIQTVRLQKLLPIERSDATNLLNPDPIAFKQRMEHMRQADKRELFAPLTSALAATDDELFNLHKTPLQKYALSCE